MNKTMNYTKGKWEADHKSSVILTRDQAGEVEHVIARHITSNDIDLIAASPSMYEALKDIVADYNDSVHECKVTQASINKAIRSLSKAEGSNNER